MGREQVEAEKKYINGLLKVIELDFLDLHERMNMKKN